MLGNKSPIVKKAILLMAFFVTKYSLNKLNKKLNNIKYKNKININIYKNKNNTDNNYNKIMKQSTYIIDVGNKKIKINL